MPAVRISKQEELKDDSDDDIISSIKSKRGATDMKTLKIISEAKKYLEDSEAEAFYWKKIAATRLVPEVREQSAMVCTDNKIYLFGGLSNDCLGDFFWWDTIKWKWEKCSINCDDWLVEPRFSHSAVAYKDQIVIYGGLK